VDKRKNKTLTNCLYCLIGDKNHSAEILPSTT